MIHEGRGDWHDADTLFVRAEAELLRVIGPGVSHAAARAGMARLAWRRGEASAVEVLREVLKTSDELFGLESPASVRARLDLARVVPGEAKTLLLEGAKTLRGEEAEPALLAEILWELAQLEAEPRRADELLEEAQVLVAAGASPRFDRLIAIGVMRPLALRSAF